jgi:hypothetical protein
MDARPTLFMLARILDEQGLEAIMIGNAAAHCTVRLSRPSILISYSARLPAICEN